MDIEEIGRRIKRKHPGSYDDLSDFRVGQMAIRKKPEYRKMAQEGVDKVLGEAEQRRASKAMGSKRPEDLGEFTRKALTTGTDPGDIQGKNFLGTMARSSIKGLTSPLAAGRMLGRVEETRQRIKMSQNLSEGRKELADMNTRLIKKLRQTDDPEDRKRLEGAIDNNFVQLEALHKKEIANEKRMFTVQRAAGTTLEAGATVAAMGLGSPTTLLGRAKQRALLGAVEATGGAQREEAGATETSIMAAGGAALGAASPYIEAGISEVWHGTRNGIRRVASALRGRTPGSLDIIIDNPNAAARGIRETATSGKKQEELYKKALNGLSKLKKSRRDGWQNASEELYNQNRGWKADLPSLKNRVKTIFGDEFGAIDSKGNFWEGKTAFMPDEEKQARKLWDVVIDWDRPSVEGTIALRNKMDQFYDYGAGSNKVNALAYAVKKEVDDELVGLDGYELMKQNYKLQSELIDKIQKDLKISYDKTPRMAINVMQKMFQKNSPYRDELLKEFSEYAGEDVLAEIAGMAYADWFPRGLTRRIIGAEAGSTIARGGVTAGEAVGTAITAGVSSPRIAAEAALAKASVKRLADETLEKALPTITKAVQEMPSEKIKKQAILQLIRALSSGNISEEE